MKDEDKTIAIIILIYNTMLILTFSVFQSSVMFFLLICHFVVAVSLVMSDYSGLKVMWGIYFGIMALCTIFNNPTIIWFIISIIVFCIRLILLRRNRYM